MKELNNSEKNNQNKVPPKYDDYIKNYEECPNREIQDL